MLSLKKYDDLTDFKKAVTPYLELDEVINGLLLGLLQNISDHDEKPQIMATVIKDNKLALVLLQTHPRQIILSKAEPFTSNEIQEIARLLHGKYHIIPGLIGEKNLILEMATYISTFQQTPMTIHMNQRLYKLVKVKKDSNKNGQLRKIEMNEKDLIKEWTYQFSVDINEPFQSKEHAEKNAVRAIERGRIYGWEVDGALVSMANATRPTKHNITINYVYTPLSKRKKGYASNCVSALTQALLDEGFYSISLYTDLGNPTSNKIYMEIGYEPVLDTIVVHFLE